MYLPGIASQFQLTVINSVIQRTFPRIALIGSQTIAFILSFFRNVVIESNQIDFLKNARDDPINEDAVYAD